MSPKFTSKDGIWHPSKERVALKNHSNKTIVNPSEEGSKYAGEKIAPGADYIYEGSDRAALFELFKDKVSEFGQNFHHDIELISRVKQLGYADVDEYAKVMGYDKEKVEAEFNKNASIVNQHELPKKVAAIKELGGGVDTTGSGNDMAGDFGEPPHLK